MEIIAQAIGFIALGITFAGFQINNRKALLITLMFSASLYSVHFLLLGALTGAALNAINILRNYIFAQKYDKKWAHSNIWPVLFVGAYFLAGILTWAGLYSILPVIGMATGAVGSWMKNPKNIRLIALIAPPCWFTYNLIVGSYAGVAVEIITATSIIIAIIRFDILKTTKKPKRQS